MNSQSGERVSSAPNAEALVHGQGEAGELALYDGKTEESEGRDGWGEQDLVHCHLHKERQPKTEHKRQQVSKKNGDLFLARGQWDDGSWTLATPRIAMGFCLQFCPHIRDRIVNFVINEPNLKN